MMGSSDQEVEQLENWMRVSEWVDIAAPRGEVFALLLNLERRMQLSPLWGLSKIEALEENYPEVGSRYHMRFVHGSEVEYDTVITDLVPDRKLAYRLEAPQKTEVSWNLQDAARGTRLTYTETFLVEDADREAFNEAVQKVVRDWLKNIQRYAELRQGSLDPKSRRARLILWLLDNFYLKLRNDQRKVVQVILFMQAVSLISFIMAALAFGLVGLTHLVF